MTILDTVLRRSTSAADTDDPLDWERPCQHERRLRGLFRTGEIEEDMESPGVTAVHWAPRRPHWTSTPQGVGNFYCRQPGGTEYILIRIEPGDEYADGRLEFAGPLPDPRES